MILLPRDIIGHPVHLSVCLMPVHLLNVPTPLC